MELRSGSRLSSQPLPGARRRPRPRRCPDSSGEDLISTLPDDMLLQILVRLRCARAAAHTSFLSRRWRGLWRHLYELSFREIALDAVDAALQQVACPTLSRLEIEIPEEHRIMDPARVSALLNAAARLDPVDLVIDVWGDIEDRDFPIEIPCFKRATSIKLHVSNLYLTLPAVGADFPVLERLYFAGCRVGDMVELSRRCPHLRVLELCNLWGFFTVKVHSQTIEKLVMDGTMSNLDIVAPVLKQFKLEAFMPMNFSVLFSALMVEDLSLSYSFDSHCVGISEIWFVRSLDIRTEDNAYVLMLDINFVREEFLVDGDLFQRMAPLPEISVLEVYLGSNGHVFGAMMLDLLGTCSAILRLAVIIRSSPITQACPPDCLCDESPDWRSQTIPLMSLEEIEIDGFEGTGHEVDFLKLLFRCATLLKRMTVRLSHKLSRRNRGYKEMSSIFKANPSVQCSVYRSSGEY